MFTSMFDKSIIMGLVHHNKKESTYFIEFWDQYVISDSYHMEWFKWFSA